MKALKLAMQAKEAFPWLIMQTIGTTITSVLTAQRYYYRVEVLSSLAEPESSVFWEATKAMFLVELLSTALDLLTDVLKNRAEALASRETQIRFFDGLLKMDVTFWMRQAEIKEDWGNRDMLNFWHVYMLGEEVTEFLEIPQKTLGDLVTAVALASIIVQTSSNALLFLVGANFGSTFLLWLLDLLTHRLTVLSLNGVVLPQDEDFDTMEKALDPDYIATYLSFVRGPIETARYAYHPAMMISSVFLFPTTFFFSFADFPK